MNERPITDKPIPDIYTAIDNDLARDNLENHLPLSDIEDIFHARREAAAEDI